jgi:hypothetical protein
MSSENRKKAVCDQCKYHKLDNNTAQAIDIPTENSFQLLSEEQNKNDSGENFITLRNRTKKRRTSLPDFTSSFTSANENNYTLSCSLPDVTTCREEIINELKDEIAKLRNELNIANNEIDNLNITNRQLIRKVETQESIIKLYKTVSIDDLNKSAKNGKSFMSTPIRNIRENTLPRNEIMISSSNKVHNTMVMKNKPTLLSTPKSDAAVTGRNDKRKKICFISSTERESTAKVIRNKFGEYEMCHYRVPGGGALELSSRLQEKLKGFTMNDYCVIMLGETDFTVSKKYLYVVHKLRQTLLTVQHTHVIICVPTYKYCSQANLFNNRVEIFNNLIYRDNVKHEYCYVLDSNKNLECSHSMFLKQNGMVNNHGVKIILNDIMNQILAISFNVINEDYESIVNASSNFVKNKNNNCSFRD